MEGQIIQDQATAQDQEAFNRIQQDYFKKIKAGSVWLDKIPKKYLAGEKGTWLCVAALMRDTTQYADIPRENRNFACLCACLVGKSCAGARLITDTDSKYLVRPLRYAIAKSNLNTMSETLLNRYDPFICDLDPADDRQVKEHRIKYKQQKELNSFVKALQAKAIIGAMDHDCITYQELSNQFKINLYVARYAVYKDRANINSIPTDYSYDLSDGKALKAQILNEIMTGYLYGKEKSPCALIRQKVDHIINDKLFELYARNESFTPVPDVDIMPDYDGTQSAAKTASKPRRKSSGSARTR